MTKNIEALWKHKAGWLAPCGTIYPVDPFEHLEALSMIDDAKVAHIVADYQTELDNIQEEEGNYDLEENGGGGMHYFDIARDNVRDNFIKSMYEEGWIRLGISQKDGLWSSPRTKDQFLEGEGLRQYISASSEGGKALRDIAWTLNIDLHILCYDFEKHGKYGLMLTLKDHQWLIKDGKVV